MTIRSDRFRVKEATVSELPIVRPKKKPKPPTPAERVRVTDSIEEAFDLVDALYKRFKDPDRASRIDEKL